ncbi:MAG: DNA polymerase III subunit gamma/tau [bacterium]|nr:DNA polymerase III subunit gamma/tau [bacterium]MDY4098669.1 DNA polymerase III subunit gamma/tau [Lachnospiraceae bacterium]
MAYTALYRKFRPNEFEDVKGQEHIVTTLKNQIKADRIGHAYLFCGTRGTGKTTVAKIFAKAVNCEHPVDGSPCGECASCRAIAAGSSMNVIEIDAASNNGVDNIREIREEVNYSPTEGRYKVYIIDEVHMLSIGAFNALLKTLEEPPSYVIFILATTEAHKIPITILSRCQRYDFRRISIDTIAARLKHLMEQEQVEVEEKAIRYVAKAADGSMRDALSLLDQCIAFYLGQKLTYDHVLEVLGAVDTEIFSALLRKVLDKNITGAIALLEELVIQGRELGQFVIDFTWYLRNLLLVQSADDMEDVLDISSENLKLLKEEAKMVRPEVLMRFIHVFSQLSNQIKYSSQKRILIEIAIIKLCRPAMDQDLDSLLQRIDDLEKKIENGAFTVMPAVSGSTQTADAGQTTPVHKRPELPKAVPEDIQHLVKNWNLVLGDLSGLVRNYLKMAHLSLGSGNVLLIVLEDTVAVAFLNEEEHLIEIREAIEKNIGKQVEIDITANESGQPFGEVYADLEELIQMDIEVEEDSEGGF